MASSVTNTIDQIRFPPCNDGNTVALFSRSKITEFGIEIIGDNPA